MRRTRIHPTPRRLTAASAAALATVLLAACGSGSGGGSADHARAARGGTVYQLTTQQEVDYDPAKSQSLGISTIHLLHRSLTTWDTRGGGKPKVVPDLATDTGKAGDGGRTWTYHLKKGLTFSDGKPITAKDVKYGIERTFDPLLSGGLSYHKTLLRGGGAYHGPYHGGELKSVETPDASTLVFHLDRAYGDWPWIVSTPAFSPVPKSADRHPSTYGRHPVSSGPYVLSSYQRNKKAVLVRNKHWKAKSAAAGTGKADRIVLELSLDENVVNERLIADSGNDRYAYTNGVPVPASLLPKVNGNPAAKERMTVSPSGALAYLAMNTRRKPLDDVDVRRAITYAVDKKAFQVASGGSQIGGDIATTLIEPGLSGYRAYNPYPAPATGDPAKATALLKKAGTGHPRLTLALGNTSSDAQKGQAIQEALRKVGITVTLKPLDDNAYTAAVTGDKGDYDLTLSSWLADFPSAAAALQPLFDSSQIGHGNYNLARYSSPEVDKKINTALGETDPAKAAADWAALDRRIQRDAPVVPLLYAKNAFLHGSKVADFTIGTYPPYPNVLTAGAAE